MTTTVLAALLAVACSGRRTPPAPPEPTPTPRAAEDGALVVEVDTARDRRPVSSQVFGINAPIVFGVDHENFLAGHEDQFAFQRLGGNRTTTYNWENNATNGARDGGHQNDLNFGAADEPAAPVRAFVEGAHRSGAMALVTVPIIGHVAADKDLGGDVSGTPDFLRRRFRENRATSPGAPAVPPDPSDGVVYQDAFVRFLEDAVPRSAPTHRGLAYALDNEPGSWDATHPRIRGGDGSARLSYAEHLQRSVDFATAIRAQAPEAEIFGPVSFGWPGFMRLADAPDANDRDYLPLYLQRLREAGRERGARLLDVMDVHFYSSAQFEGQPIDHAAGDGAEDLRMQLPRSLYDPTYAEPSWIVEHWLHEPIQLIPRLQRIIDEHYPGTRLAITEYAYGGGADISGGVAQADTLGAYARHGVYAAALWPLWDEPLQYQLGAFAMFRREAHRFGETSVHASGPDPARLQPWASVGDDGRVVVVLVHRGRGDGAVSVRVRHGSPLTEVLAYRLDARGPEPRPLGEVALQDRAVRIELDGPSVTTVVLRR